MCEKGLYATAFQAKEAMHRARARSGDFIDYYWCDCCAGYHIGHPPLSRRLSEDRRRTRRR